MDTELTSSVVISVVSDTGAGGHAMEFLKFWVYEMVQVRLFAEFLYYLTGYSGQ